MLAMGDGTRSCFPAVSFGNTNFTVTVGVKGAGAKKTGLGFLLGLGFLPDAVRLQCLLVSLLFVVYFLVLGFVLDGSGCFVPAMTLDTHLQCGTAGELRGGSAA